MAGPSEEGCDPDAQIALFDGVVRVIADPIRFKVRLGIGDDAYASMRYGRIAQQLWDVGGVAATGAGIAGSTTVATTFFASTGFWASIGFGAAAVTPIGWVAAAAMASGGAYYGVARLFKGYAKGRVDVIPKFINTPLDVLGSRLFDMMALLAVKVAWVDGVYAPEERDVIMSHFREEWGFDPSYVEAALTTVEQGHADTTLADIATTLATFKRGNPDCNVSHMAAELVAFLTEIAESDGVWDEREEMAIERVRTILKSGGKVGVGKRIAAAGTGVLATVVPLTNWLTPWRRR